jgi:hypothetical protein
MAYSNRVTWETLRSVDSATLAGSYVNLGTPLQFPSYISKMVNNSNVLVTISIDGVNDIDVCPANSFWLYDEGKVGRDGAFPALPAGTQIKIKGAAGTGLIYFVTQYLINV